MTTTTTAPSPTRLHINRKARIMLDQHGLTEWRFGWHSSKTKLGTCTYATKTITMSAPLLPHQTPSDIENTLLHEIAHALTPGHGHNDVWRSKFVSIGGNGQRTGGTKEQAKAARMALGRYEVRCTLDEEVLFVAHRSSFKVAGRKCRQHRCEVILWDRQTMRRVK